MKVITAWAEKAHGPGWNNALYWVLVERGGALSVEAIQPEEQTPLLRALHDPSATIAKTVTAEARRVLGGGK